MTTPKGSDSNRPILIFLAINVFVAGALFILIVTMGPGEVDFWNWRAGPWQAVATYAAGIALAGFAMVTWTLQRNNAKSDAYQKTMDRLEGVNRLLVENPKLLKKLGDSAPLTLDFKFTDPCVHLMDTIFNMYEEIWEQCFVFRMLRRGLWEDYGDAKIRSIFKESQYAQLYWDTNIREQKFFHPDFLKLVGEILDDVRKPEGPDTPAMLVYWSRTV